MPKHLPALGIAYNNRYTHYLATVIECDQRSSSLNAPEESEP
jgi:hypothetical protein